MKLMLLILPLLTSCSPDNNAFSGIDPIFIPYYNDFYMQYGVMPAVSIEFKKLNAPVIVGVCDQYTDGYRQIQIDKNTWDSIDSNAKFVLIFHELGHCVFNRLHNRQVLNDGCPASIMNPSNFSGTCWMNHTQYYLNELPKPEVGDAI